MVMLVEGPTFLGEVPSQCEDNTEGEYRIYFSLTYKKNVNCTHYALTLAYTCIYGNSNIAVCARDSVRYNMQTHQRQCLY